MRKRFTFIRRNFIEMKKKLIFVPVTIEKKNEKKLNRWLTLTYNDELKFLIFTNYATKDLASYATPEKIKKTFIVW